MAVTNPTILKMVAESFYIPKVNPEKPLGEDAHFISQAAQVIGIADGVGGWAKKGIDAGEYARELMMNAAETIKNSSYIDPKDVLIEAYVNTSAQGSSTACIITLDGNLLRAANLGDSGFLVIRGGKAVYKCPIQQFRFNGPYQIGNPGGNLPEEAADVVVEVENGDVVVAGSDGLFDNMFTEDIEALVEDCLEKGMWPGKVARKLARAARGRSMEKRVVSPFEVAAYEAGVIHFGGKYDDITVVVAYVVEIVDEF